MTGCPPPGLFFAKASFPLSLSLSLSLIEEMMGFIFNQAFAQVSFMSVQGLNAKNLNSVLYR